MALWSKIEDEFHSNSDIIFELLNEVVEKENAAAKEEGEKQAEQNRQEMQEEADKEAEEIRQEIEQSNQDLQDKNEEEKLLKEYSYKEKVLKKEYKKKIHIEGKKPDEKYFTFVLYTKHIMGGIFRRSFYYEAWMSGFSWSNVCEKEALQLLYDLFIDGIVEPTEFPRTPKERGGEK